MTFHLLSACHPAHPKSLCPAFRATRGQWPTPCTFYSLTLSPREPQASGLCQAVPSAENNLALADFYASFGPQLTFLLLWEVLRPPLERSSLPLWPPTTRRVPISLITLGYHCCILHPIRSCSSQKLGHPGPFCVPSDNLLKGSVTI